MTKKEIIWREILFQATENKNNKGTQKELAQKYAFSLSTVFNALKIPRQSGAIEVGGNGFKVINIEKFLYLWATFRKFKKDIIYQTNIPQKIQQIEGEMPPGVIFAAFSAVQKKYKEAPADYDKVYIYLEKNNLNEIKNRFPERKGYINLIVLEEDAWLKNFGQTTPSCQTFVDLWNISEWYAKEFTNFLKEKIIR